MISGRQGETKVSDRKMDRKREERCDEILLTY